MHYVQVSIRTARIVHGFDEQNQAIIEEVNETVFVNKLVALERVQSISEQYLLVTASHGRVMYWEYEGGLADIRSK